MAGLFGGLTDGLFLVFGTLDGEVLVGAGSRSEEIGETGSDTMSGNCSGILSGISSIGSDISTSSSSF